MKKQAVAILLVGTIVLGLCACGKREAEVTPPPVSTGETTLEPTGERNMLDIYQKALVRLLVEHIGLDGYEYGPKEWVDNGRIDFAIHDVDGDGVEELILQFADMSIYMYHTDVYGYDVESGEFLEEFWGTAPDCSFYDNGAARCNALHQSNGLAGRIWPYAVSMYDKETGEYQNVASVDAYDLETMEMVGAQELYPKEIDIEEAGFVYLISSGEEKTTMSQSEYDAWYDAIFGGAKEIELDYQPLTVANVGNLYYEGNVRPKVDVNVMDGWFDGELWNELSERQKELMNDLPVDELPREAAGENGDIRMVRENGEIWRDTLLPLCHDEKNDFTLYAVIAEKSDPVGFYWNGAGILTRKGDTTDYCSIGHEQFWTGSSPRMVVKDFNGDGSDEAAVVLYSGHGTGVSIETLYIFDLGYDWLPLYETVDFSGVDIDVAYDGDTKTVTLTSGESALTVKLNLDFPEDWEFSGVYAGNVVHYRYEDGKLLCELGLDFSGCAVGYLVKATGEVIYENGRYALGPLTLEADV